jgi:hypothetical protein
MAAIVGAGSIARIPGRAVIVDGMDDREILERVNALVAEEHQLESRHAGEGLSPDERNRLTEVEVALDQCWDLLRQRRARRNAGQDPDEAEARPATTVERYRQ